ncbi:MAG TPA: hypothetical protein V6D03_09875 [Candidatus Caenarcaniphilales bacterium]
MAVYRYPPNIALHRMAAQVLGRMPEIIRRRRARPLACSRLSWNE